MRVTEPLRAEHRALVPHIEELRAAGELVGQAEWAVLRDAVRRNLDFLEHHLLPHAAAEDAALYPAVERAMGAPGATAVMRREHTEVGALVGELRELAVALATGPLDDPHDRALRRVLFGLYTLVRVHFGNEEEVYLSMLDERLTAAEADAMFAALRRAAAAAAAA